EKYTMDFALDNGRQVNNNRCEQCSQQLLQSLPWLESGVDGNDEDNNRGLGQQQTHLCCLRCGRCGCYLREKCRETYSDSTGLIVYMRDGQFLCERCYEGSASS
ncbi:hypothetical protein BOX15_Mlig019002g1, partial [Macrostomum lignano]